jgi:hypothetical protein
MQIRAKLLWSAAKITSQNTSSLGFAVKPGSHLLLRVGFLRTGDVVQW